MTDPYAPLPASQGPRPRAETDDGICIRPAPADAPTPSLKHSQLGIPVTTWEYRDADGLHGFACRFEPEPGRKEIRYCTLWRMANGKLLWRWKHWPKPKPLYGLDRLAANRAAVVVICEGEKAATAAQHLMPGHIAICWPGGASAVKTASWTALMGREVIIWPDHDQAGHKAATAVTECLRQVHAKRILQLNREAMGRMAPLQDGDDAADLFVREQWTAEKMAEFLALPDAFIEAPTTADAGSQHVMLQGDIRQWLHAQRYDANAVGNWTRNGMLVKRMTTRTMAEKFADIHRCFYPIATDRVVEVLSVWARDRREERIDEMRYRIIGHPRSEAGALELMRFVRAVTGEESDLTLNVFAHWIWLTKRSMAGMPREWDIMPILYGQKQGSGKSTACERLCAPLEELAEKINASVLVDDRRVPELESYAVGIWDEMEGSSKADIEALKNTITCTTKSYRPLRTNDSASIERMMCFIGSSNREVRQMVKDTTGARRFYQVDCMDRLDHETINGLDYGLLWRCVSEQDPAPIKPHLSELFAHQEDLRHTDSVGMWLAVETWAGFLWQRHEGLTQTINPYDPDLGESAEDLRARYHHWAKLNAEQPVSNTVFFQRVKEEGFQAVRLRSFDRQRRYFKPVPREARDVPGGVPL